MVCYLSLFNQYDYSFYDLLFFYTYSLFVCSNSIRDDGLCTIAEVLQTSNSTLNTLYIWGNKWQTATCNVSERPAKWQVGTKYLFNYCRLLEIC